MAKSRVGYKCVNYAQPIPVSLSKKYSSSNELTKCFQAGQATDWL